jgi:tryptophan synthase alpha chain
MTSAVATARASAPALDAAKAQGRSALVAYLPIGYPDLATSVAAAKAAVAGGADVLELGMPYSDPLMDGPVIQHAVELALRGGTRTRDLFTAVEQVRGAGAPALVMTYWNPVERYGVDAFARDLAAAGGAGLITPDLIPDEAAEWLAASQTHDLERVFLVAPSSTPARLAATAAACRGWVYAASTMGVTGERTSLGARAEQLVANTRAAGAQRVCVGVGVSTREHARQVAGFADGVIVGSAFVRALTDADTPAQGVAAVGRLAEQLAAGIADAAAGDPPAGA